MKKTDLKSYANKIVDIVSDLTEDEKIYFMKVLRVGLKSHLPKDDTPKVKKTSAYTDFVKSYKQQNPQLSGRELISQASKEWQKMKN